MKQLVWKLISHFNNETTNKQINKKAKKKWLSCLRNKSKEKYIFTCSVISWPFEHAFCIWKNQFKKRKKTPSFPEEFLWTGLWLSTVVQRVTPSWNRRRWTRRRFLSVQWRHGRAVAAPPATPGRRARWTLRRQRPPPPPASACPDLSTACRRIIHPWASTPARTPASEPAAATARAASTRPSRSRRRTPSTHGWPSPVSAIRPRFFLFFFQKIFLISFKKWTSFACIIAGISKHLTAEVPKEVGRDPQNRSSREEAGFP